MKLIKGDMKALAIFQDTAIPISIALIDLRLVDREFFIFDGAVESSRWGTVYFFLTTNTGASKSKIKWLA